MADRLSTQLGYTKVYYTKNPFDFMERISLEGKDNFFEKRVTTYAKANTSGKAEEKTFSMGCGFLGTAKIETAEGPTNGQPTIQWNLSTKKHLPI